MGRTCLSWESRGGLPWVSWCHRRWSTRAGARGVRQQIGARALPGSSATISWTCTSRRKSSPSY